MSGNHIGILTSGGDAAGMNAAIRAIVRTALANGWRPYAIRSGFSGLLGGDISSLEWQDVSGIIQVGGTVLRSARSQEFMLPSAPQKAIELLHHHEIDVLVVIGGEGSQRGAHALSVAGFPVIGLPATIDNDLFGTDVALGVDSAVNVALEAIDRLKVTAASHSRAFIVEVMGRKSGYLALAAGIAGGAEVVVVPEIDSQPEAIVSDLHRAYERGHAHAIAVVAEGAHYNADALAEYFKTHAAEVKFELRVTKLGHVQRGSAPGAFDRLLGTQLGFSAFDYISRGQHGVLLGRVGGKLASTPLATVTAEKKEVDSELTKLARLLAI